MNRMSIRKERISDCCQVEKLFILLLLHVLETTLFHAIYIEIRQRIRSPLYGLVFDLVSLTCQTLQWMFEVCIMYIVRCPKRD